MSLNRLFVMTNTSPASASTAVGAQTITGLDDYDWFEVDGYLQGATGGTLDVYIQRKVATDTWVDWIHFSQLAAAAAAIKQHVPPNGTLSGITTIGGGSDATPGVALAAGSACGCHPGDALRMVFVAGAGTSVGASQTLRVRASKMGE
jgi:hypothetical protein